jgi:hypothetical protein
LDARKFTKQRLLIDDIRLRIDWRVSLLSEGRRRESDETTDNNGGKHETYARQAMYHDRSFRRSVRRWADPFVRVAITP